MKRFGLHDNRVILKLIYIVLLFLPTLLHHWHNSYLLLFLLLFFIWEFSSVYFYAVVGSVLAAEIVYTHIVHHWGSSHIGSRIEVMFESPLYEAYEYLGNYIDWVDIAVVIYAIAMAVILGRYPLENALFRPFKKAFLTASVLLLVFVVKASHFEPLDLYRIIYESINRNSVLEERLASIGQSDNNFTLPENSYEKIVIVIGESASKHHMSIYGYKRRTTPFLESLHPYVFDAIAPTNQTRYSVPMILSDAGVGHWDDFFTSPSLVTLLKREGYYTYWISNQRARGRNDTTIASIAHEANERYFLNQNSSNYSAKDRVILKQLDAMAQKRKKEAYFIHLIGSHAGYAARYESLLAPFGGEDIVTQYDNSIYYTDYILSNIYEHFKKDKLLLVYFSDHAEIVSSRRHGHGYSPAFKDEYEVPFIVFSTQSNPYLERLTTDESMHFINLDRFPDLLLNILNQQEKRKIHYSNDVLSLEPENIKNYDRLDRFR